MAESAPTARGVGLDALLYVPGRAIPALVQVLTVTVLTHYFSVAEVGRYDLAFRFALCLCTATVLWLNMAVLRLYPAHAERDSLPSFFSVLAWLRYGLMGVGALVGVLCWRFGPEAVFGSYRDLLLPATAVFLGYTVYESGLAVLRARRMPLRYSVAASVNALCRLPLAVVLFVWMGQGVVGMLWALTITYLVAHAVFLWGQTGGARWAFGAREREIARTILLYGLPVAGAQLLNFFLGNLDRYFIQQYRGEAEVGLYAVATNLIDQPMMLVFQTFTMAVFPSVASAWERHGRGVTEGLLGGVTRIYLVVCIPIGVFLSVFSGDLFALLARGEAAQAAAAAPWIAGAAFLYGLHYLANFGLHLAHRTGQLLVATVVALAVNAGLNFWLVPGEGFVGAGMARVGANAAFVLLLVVLSRRHLRWLFPWGSAVRVVLLSLVGVVAGLGVKAVLVGAPVWLVLGAVGVVYGGVLAGGLLLSGEVPRDVLRRRGGGAG